MAIYGGFETVQELDRSVSATVWVARRVGTSGPGDAVVKVCELVPSVGDVRQAQADAEALLAGATLQQRMAAQGAPHWAPVHALGRMPAAAFYVTDRYSRSFQHLILGQTKLRSRDLHHLIGSVVDGLFELREVLGRAHGRLKPTNILIRGEGRLDRVQVFLSDPLPDGPDGRPPDTRADLVALGELIYELVLHQAFRKTGRWPVPPSAAWQALGPNGEAWRRLCNDLLNTDPAAPRIDLDQMAERLRALYEGRRYLTPPRLVAGLLVGILIGCLFVPAQWVKAIREGLWCPATPWQTLCEQYESWFGSFYTEFDWRNRWAGPQADPLLQKAAALLAEAENTQLQFDPRRIINENRTLTDLKSNPPRQRCRTEVRQAVDRALKKMQDVREVFTSLLTKCEEDEGVFRQWGWREQADRLQALRVRVKEPAAGWGHEVERLVASGGWTRCLIDHCARIVSFGTDEILNGFLGWLRAQLDKTAGGPPDPSSRQSTLDQWNALADRVSEFLKSHGAAMNWELFRQEAEVYKKFDPKVPPTPESVQESLRRWLAEAPGHVALSGDLGGDRAAWEKRLAPLGAILEALSKIDPQDAERFRTTMPSLEDLRKGLPAVAKNEAAIQKRVAEFKETVSQYEQKLAAAFGEHLRRAADAFAGYGWTAQAAFLRSCAGEVKPGDPEAAQVVADALQKARAAETRWKSLDPVRRELEALDDPVLKTFGSHALAAVNQVKSGDFAALGQVLDQWRKLADDLTAFIGQDWARVDRKRFADDSTVFRAPDTLPDEARFRRWLSAASGFLPLEDDPRKKVDWDSRRQEVDKAIGQREPSDPAAASRDRQELAQVWKEIESLLAQTGLLQKDRDAIAKRVRELETRLGRLSRTPFDEMKWRRLCEAYGGWARLLLDAAQQPRLDRYAKDPYLNQEVVQRIAQARQGGIEFDPRRIAAVQETDLAKLADHPPDTAKGETAIRQTEEALRVIDAVRSALAGDQWPWTARLRKLADEYKQRSWPAQADFVHRLLEAADPARRSDFVAGVDGLLDLQARHMKAIDAIEQAAWPTVDRLQKLFLQSKDPILARFSEYVRDEVARIDVGDFTQLAERLTALAGEKWVEELAAFVKDDWPRVDQPLFQKEERIEGSLGPELFRQWLAKARDYVPVEKDPRAAWPALQAQVDGLPGKIAEVLTGVPTDKDGGVRERLRQFQSRWDDLKQKMKSAESLPAVRKHRPLLDSLAKQAQDSKATADTLLTEAQKAKDQWQADKEKRLAEVQAKYRALNAISPSKTAVVDQAWRSERDRLLADTSDAQALEGKLEAVKAFLAALDNRFSIPVEWPERPESLPPEILARAVAARREAMLAAVLASEECQKACRGEADSDKVCRDSSADYLAWCNDLRKVLRANRAVEQLLDQAYGWQETAPASQTVEHLWLAAADRSVLPEEIQQALKPLWDRAERLRQIEAETDEKRLKAWISGPDQADLAGRRAAWRRLGHRPKADWPRTGADLQEEARYKRDLARAYEHLAPERRQLLEGELKAGALARWSRCFRRLIRERPAPRTPPEMESVTAAIQRLPDFGLTPADLDGWDQYNIALHDLKGAISGTSEKDRIRKAARVFLDKVPGELRRGNKFLDDLALLVQEETRAEGASSIGPGLSKLGGRWEKGPPADLAIYTYGRGDARLEFRKLMLAGEGTESYVGMTEVSLGLVIDAVEAAGAWEEFGKLLLRYRDGDPRLGPRVWEWTAAGEPRRIQASPRWLVPDPEWLAREYASGLSVSPPAVDYPMQYIGPAAALYLAGLLGCRLPTTAEWKAAQERELQEQKAGGSVLWNLRDAAWATQKDHVQRLDLLRPHWPDRQIFADPTDPQPEGEHAAAVTAESDGTLWFDSVYTDRGRAFRHLIGNVAEYLCDAGDAFAQRFSTPEAVSAAAVQDFLKTHGQQLFVVGGSSLSALAPEKPRRVDYHGPRGYCDVGFRLAFSSAVAVIKRLVAEAEFCLPP